MDATLNGNFIQDFTLLRQGAEARLLVGSFLGQSAIIKERFSKKYRHPILDEKLTKERLKAEARSLLRCKLIGIRTPTIYLTDIDNGLLVLEYLTDAVTCRDFIRQSWDMRESDDIKQEFSNLAKEIGKSVSILHKNNIIHGDLTTSNILVESRTPLKLCFIDFGLGFTESSAEAKGVDLYVLERALISTHPNSEWLFELMLSSYQSEMKDRKKEIQEILRKFEEIRMRGRKRDRKSVV